MPQYGSSDDGRPALTRAAKTLGNHMQVSNMQAPGPDLEQTTKLSQR